MSQQTECPTCKGEGKVDSLDGKPWAEINKKPNPRVRSGEIQPVKCVTCKGRGVVEPETPQQATEETAPIEAPPGEEEITTGHAEPAPNQHAETTNN